MAAKSEFEAILSQALNQNRDGAIKSASEGATNSAPDYLENLIAAMGPLKVQFFARTNAYGAPAKKAPHAKLKVTFVQTQTQTQVQQEVKNHTPTPRPAPRKLTFDQQKALKTFIQFGEKDLTHFSTDDEIKSAYRRLAKKFHPDLNKEKEATSFKMISLAYDKLLS